VNMFSFGRREEQQVSPEKPTSNHTATYHNHDNNGGGHGSINRNTVTSSSFSGSPSSQSSPRHQQQSKRGSGGGGGFSPRNIGRKGGKKLLGGRRFGGGSSDGRKKKDLSLDVNETSNGIEVSFFNQPGSGGGSHHDTPRSGASTPQQQAQTPQHTLQDESREPAPDVNRDPVISLKDRLRHRQRVWRSQFSVALPALQKQNVAASKDGLKPSKSNGSAGQGSESVAAQIAASNGMTSWRPKGHRIPLVGVTPPEPAYIDTLHLLQSSRVADERSAVQDELKHTETEIAALENDRKILDRHVTHQQQKEKDQQLGSALYAMSPFSFLQTSGSNGSSRDSNGSLSNVDWDGHKLLKDDAMGRHLLLSPNERSFLQHERGNSLTIRLDNPRTKEMFIHRCGGKLHQVQRSRLFKGVDSIVTIHPGNCRSPAQSSSSVTTSSASVWSRGAATDLQQVELIASTGTYNGFFLSRDGNKSQTWGRIPNKLYRRMKQEGAGGAGVGGGAEIGDLVYLSTGPHGSYYAEFQSGECWWGSAVEDADFHNLMRSWDVYRVAFGPIESVAEDEHDNKTISTSSWIIISRDGRAAWKNLPSRLTQKLEGRLASWAAPAEVSLGPGDSYFVRFLDGQVDYCLPAEIARVCERIESSGGQITSICLHPEISNDFVIRHTDMTS
jgi:hypothetical protein